MLKSEKKGCRLILRNSISNDKEYITIFPSKYSLTPSKPHADAIQRTISGFCQSINIILDASNPTKEAAKGGGGVFTSEFAWKKVCHQKHKVIVFQILIIQIIPLYISQQSLQSRNRHFFQNFNLVQSNGVLKSMNRERNKMKQQLKKQVQKTHHKARENTI